MKKLFLALALLVVSPLAHAQEGTGIGVVLGSPNGLTARHWIESDRSIEGALGWAITEGRFQVNVNYLFHQPEVLAVGDGALDLFYGAGVSLRTRSGAQNGEVVFGPRLPVGLSYYFKDPKIELFGQVALNLGLIPSSNVYVDGNVGVRFYLF